MLGEASGGTVLTEGTYSSGPADGPVVSSRAGAGREAGVAGGERDP